MGEVRSARSRGIFGAPISYVALLAAVTAVLQLIPFSVVLGPGVSFPLSLATGGLMGILLGPWAGAVAVLVGGAIGVLIAPHTAFLGPLTILVLIMAPLASGLIVTGRHRIVGIYLLAAGILWWVIYFATTGMPQDKVVLLMPWRYIVPGVLLFIPGLTEKAVRMLRSENRLALASALGYITWISLQTDHSISAIVGNLLLFPLPEEVYRILITTIIGAERGALTIVGIVIGLGVIVGLRRMGIRRPEQGVW
jgi:hypothetical protein